MRSDCKRTTVSLRDVVDTVHFVDKELAESCDQLGRLGVVVGSFVFAVQQSLCSSPGGADVTRHCLKFVLDYYYYYIIEKNFSLSHC